MRSRRALLILSLALTSTAPFVSAQAGPWQMENSGTTANLRGIHAVGEGVVWASGDRGTVLRTEDSGYMWQSCAMPPGAEKLDFRAIWAWDANTAIVMSSGPRDQSRIYKTNDGCSHWTLTYTNPDKDGFWDTMQFGVATVPSASSFTHQGVLVGDPVRGEFPIFLTSDQGEHWYRWGRSQDMKRGICGEHKASSRREEALFAASNEALLIKADTSSFLFVTGGVGGSRLLATGFFSMDGPPCWTAIHAQTLSLTVGASSGAFAVAAKEWVGYLPDDLVIVGGDYARPVDSDGNSLFGSPRTYFVPFGGPFRLEASHTPPSGYRSAVQWYPDQDLWITVGPNGSDLSRDDGKTWQPIEHAPANIGKGGEWNALSLPWVVGPNGRIAKLNAEALPKPVVAGKR